MFIQPKYKVSGVFAIAQCYESLGMNPEIALNDRDGIGFYTTKLNSHPVGKKIKCLSVLTHAPSYPHYRHQDRTVARHFR